MSPNTSFSFQFLHLLVLSVSSSFFLLLLSIVTDIVIDSSHEWLDDLDRHGRNGGVSGAHVQYGTFEETWNLKGVNFSSFNGVMVKGFHFADPEQIVNAFLLRKY